MGRPTILFAAACTLACGPETLTAPTPDLGGQSSGAMESKGGTGWMPPDDEWTTAPDEPVGSSSSESTGAMEEPPPGCGDGVVGAAETCDGGPIANGECTPMCELDCDFGWEDCDASIFNGCEADLSSASHCGGCGMECPEGGVCLDAACVVPTIHGEPDLDEYGMNMSPDSLRTQPVVVSEPGVLVGVGVRTQLAVGQLRMGVYLDDDGAPGTLVAQTDALPVEEGTQTITLDPVPVAAGTYHVGLVTSSPGVSVWASSASIVVASSVDHDFALPLPDPSGASWHYASAAVSVFVLVVH